MLETIARRKHQAPLFSLMIDVFFLLLLLFFFTYFDIFFAKYK